MQEFVSIEEVTRAFGSLIAVSELSLTLGRGEIMGFLGTNGAGKTTTIKMLTGLLKPTAGTVRVLGGDPSDADVRKRIGYMPETGRAFRRPVTGLIVC